MSYFEDFKALQTSTIIKINGWKKQSIKNQLEMSESLEREGECVNLSVKRNATVANDKLHIA